MKTWSLAGKLNFGRYGHAAIFDGESFLVVGGFDVIKNEVCTLDEDKNVTCKAQLSTLFYWRYYPEIFLVDDTYGDDLTCK